MPDFRSQKMTSESLMSAWTAWKGVPVIGSVILAGAAAGKAQLWESSAPLPAWGELVSEGAFIWEVLLYAEKSWSISIRHADGYWIVNTANWDIMEPTEALKKAGITYHESKTLALNASKPMRWIEIWLPVADPLSENIPVLQPTHLAFTGFLK